MPIAAFKSPGIGAAGIPASLKTNLLSWWTMQSTGVPLADATGNHPLPTRFGTPTGGAGKVGNCGIFDGVNQKYYDSAANTTAYDVTTGEFTAACWVAADVAVFTSNGPFSRHNSLSGGQGWFIKGGTNWSGAFGHAVSGNITVDSGVPILTNGTFQLVMIWKRNTPSEYGIQVNNNAAVTVAGGDIESATYLLGIGGVLGNYFDGKIDEVAFWTRALSAAERTALYNGGAGITYANIP